MRRGPGAVFQGAPCLRQMSRAHHRDWEMREDQGRVSDHSAASPSASSEEEGYSKPFISS